MPGILSFEHNGIQYQVVDNLQLMVNSDQLNRDETSTRLVAVDLSNRLNVVCVNYQGIASGESQTIIYLDNVKIAESDKGFLFTHDGNGNGSFDFNNIRNSSFTNVPITSI